MMKTAFAALAMAGLLMAPATSLSAEEDSKDTPRAGEKSFKKGIKLMQAGRYTRAMGALERALPYYESSSDIFYYLTRISQVRKTWRRAALYGAGFLFLEKTAKEVAMVKSIIKAAQKALAKKGVLQVEVRFAIAPKGVEMRVNHVPLGMSQGGTILLYPGTYTVSGKTGNYYPWKKEVVIKKGGAKQTVTGTMRRMIKTGFLAITTQPAKGVTVYIDNKKIGVTPLKPLKLQTGKYLLRFEKKGWDRWHRYIFVENDQTTKLKPVMERTPPGKSPYRID